MHFFIPMIFLYKCLITRDFENVHYGYHGKNSVFQIIKNVLQDQFQGPNMIEIKF